MTKKIILSLLCIMAAVVAMISLVQSQDSCNQIVDARLHEGIQQSPAEMADWVADHYLFGSFRSSEQRRGSVNLYEWSTVGSLYRAVMGNTVQAIYQLHRFKYLSMRKIVRCFGEPAFYAGAWDFGPEYFEFHVSLIYPDEGYVFATRWIFAGNQRKTEIDIDDPYFILIAVKPGNPEEMLQNAYPPDVLGEQILNDSLETLQEFPEAYDSLQLERSQY